MEDRDEIWATHLGLICKTTVAIYAPSRGEAEQLNLGMIALWVILEARFRGGGSHKICQV